MSRERYYVMFLDDYAAASFTSFSKMYFGTLEEFTHFIRLLEKDEKLAEAHKETIEAFYEYINGNTKATHIVAHKKVPILSSVKVKASNSFKFGRKKWTHINTWGFPMKMKAYEVTVDEKIFLYRSQIYRAIRPSFRNLRDYSPFADKWELRQDGFWGFPHMLDLEGDWNRCRFFVVNDEYDDFSQACEDMYNEKKIDFKPVIDEVYGNG